MTVGMEETVTAIHHQDWTALAKCRGTEDAMFGAPFDQKRASLLCASCPVRSECLAEALDNRIEWGVWGGMTERERRLLLRQRADISSWKSVLVVQRQPRSRGAASALSISSERGRMEANVGRPGSRHRSDPTGPARVGRGRRPVGVGRAMRIPEA